MISLHPIQVVEEFYSTKFHVREDIEMGLGFEQKMIRLSIPRSGYVLESGWTIKPRYDPIVGCQMIIAVYVVMSYYKLKLMLLTVLSTD